jgi:AcrR family transcriptional regulator
LPSPRKTTSTEIVAAARELVERRGRDGLSMAAVADAVGVRAPSLYGHVADRAALLAAVELDLWWELRGVLARTRPSADPALALARQARAYRAFAKANPRGYAVMYDADAERTEAGHRARLESVAVAMASFIALVGERDALRAARVLAPFLHGFVSMELNGAFRLGPGIDAAFEYGVKTITDGLAARRKRATSRRR